MWTHYHEIIKKLIENSTKNPDNIQNEYLNVARIDVSGRIGLTRAQHHSVVLVGNDWLGTVSALKTYAYTDKEM